jgi:hypothetical protein
MRDRMPMNMEPTAASSDMNPSLAKRPFWIGPKEQEFGPLGIGQSFGRLGTGNMRRAAISKFGFVSRAAPRAID